MRNSTFTSAALCSALILLVSCATIKDSVVTDKPENIKETARGCYVKMNDGTIQFYSTLKLVTGVFVTPHLLADNKIVLNAKDITAYQVDDHYMVSKKLLSTNKNGCIAEDALPGFAERVVKGKLNVYHRKYYNGQRAVDEYFLQSGNEGPIVAFTPELLNSLVKDNQKAMEYFNSKIKNNRKQNKLLATVDMYNKSSQMISEN